MRVGWRRVVSSAFALACAGAALQCGSSSSTPSTPSANAGTAAGGAASGGADGVGGAGGATSGSGAAGASGSGGGGAGGSTGAVGGDSGVGGFSGAAGRGAAGAGGSGGVGIIGVGGTGFAGAAGGGNSCSVSVVAFQPRTPVVYFLLSRSGSMFAPTGRWSVMKASILATIQAFNSQVRFGFAAYTGVAASTCPLGLTRAADIALNNYDEIQGLLAPLGSVGTKAENPTAAALATLRPSLAAESGTDKTIFLIRASEDDFCDDSDTVCSSDAVVSELQKNFAAGIRASLFNLDGPVGTELTHVQAQANAGAGLPPVGTDGATIYFTCNGVSAWHALWTALGSVPNTPLGTYASTSSVMAPFASLDTAAPASVTAALTSAVSAQKSCTFDLASGHVTLGTSEHVAVRIDGVNVPEDANNGFRMNSTTELELRGSACTAWRSVAAMAINFDVPCSIWVP